jgi:hypothetical protein
VGDVNPAHLGLDRFGQEVAEFNDLAATLDRIADAGGTRTELRDTAVRQAVEQVAAVPSPVVNAPRVHDLVRHFGEYCRHVQVPEVIEVYRALRRLAVVTRETAGVIERCEVFERNWLDQLGHDLGRDWEKAWHTVFEFERSDEANREHDLLADQARAASVERAGALDRWRTAVAEACVVISRATAALATRPADCPTELLPPSFPLGITVASHVQTSWLNRSALPAYDRLKHDPDRLAAWWDSLSTAEKLKLREARPELRDRFPDVLPGPGEPGYCTPGELAADRYIGRVDAATDFLGLPRLPDCAQDIPEWFVLYRYQLTQVTLPAEEGVAFLGALSGGLAQMAAEIGVPPDALIACHQGDEIACAKVAVALGMVVPTGGRRGGGYHPPPKSLSAFPDAAVAQRKTPVQGGGSLRKRWKDPDGFIYEWDSQHGTVEKYTKKGRHLGEFDAETGTQTKPADPTRTVER